MDFFLFYLLGILDILAVFAIAFKVFRLPYFEYFKDFFIIALVVNTSSYVLRVVLDVPFLDPPLQLLIFVLFFRYRIKLRFSSAILMVVCGNAGFLSIQFQLFNLLNMTGVVSTSDAQGTAALGTYIIQFSNHVACFLISYLMYKTGLGIALINEPPHDLYYNDRLLNRAMFTLLVICSSLVCMTVVFLNYFINYMPYVSLIFLLTVSVLVHLTYRKDRISGW